METTRKLIKRLARRLRGEDYIFEGENIIYDESSGNIRHQYSFDEIDSRTRAEHVDAGMFWGDESVIRYHLTQYPDEARVVWLGLVEDTIHELTHWALDEEANSSLRGQEGDDHTQRWRKVIFPQIEYVNNVEIENED